MDKNRERCLTVLSLGAGVQSSAMAIMAAKGDFPKVDCAIFADTGYEPKAVYKYLEFLKKILPYPIYIVAKGNIKDDMISSIDNGTRFPTAPFFTKNAETNKKGMLRRQCTNDYKIQPIRQKIRQLSNVAKGKLFPKDKYVEQWIGISMDEIGRMKPARDKYILNRHPLIEAKMSRQDCIDYLKKNDILLFGRESAGVPEILHSKIKNKLKVPISKKTRSLNVAMTVAIVASEALRQNNFFK